MQEDLESKESLDLMRPVFKRRKGRDRRLESSAPIPFLDEAEVSSSLELRCGNARKGLSGPTKGREPGHWDRNFCDKIKACRLPGPHLCFT